MRFRFASFCLALMLVAPAFSQQQSSEPTFPPPETGRHTRDVDPQFHPRRNDETTATMERDQQKRLNLDRQKQLQKDTDRLLELATELKQYVDKTNENILSVNVMRKAEEIEKLAHQVKDKMKAQ